MNGRGVDFLYDFVGCLLELSLVHGLGDSLGILRGRRFFAAVVLDRRDDAVGGIGGVRLVARWFQLVVVGRGVAVGVERFGFRDADADFRVGIQPERLRMGVVHHVGMAGGSVQYDGHLRVERRHNQDTALVVPGGGKQHALVDDAARRSGFVGIFPDIHRTAVVGELFVAGVVVYLGDIPVYQTGRADPAHAARSHLDALDAPPQRNLPNSRLNHPPVVVL